MSRARLSETSVIPDVSLGSVTAKKLSLCVRDERNVNRPGAFLWMLRVACEGGKVGSEGSVELSGDDAFEFLGSSHAAWRASPAWFAGS